MNKDFVVCIPARYNSSRLPGKPLIKIKGKELILWAVESATLLNPRDLVIATDDQRIYNCVMDNGHQAIMTSEHHQSGTERIAECAEIMNWSNDTLVLNYQGDEPNIPKNNVNAVLSLFDTHPNISIGTLYKPIQDIKDIFDPNIVKVVTDTHNKALYFSRAPIPWKQSGFDEKQILNTTSFHKHHIGLYAYKVSFLKEFVRHAPTDIELIESLEQLRALYYGYDIAVAEAVDPMPHGIDTPQDIINFEMNHS